MFGIVAIFVSIPNANLIYAIAGLVIFGGFTIFDFNRLRRAGAESAVPIAASIFLDIFNVFLFHCSCSAATRLTSPGSAARRVGQGQLHLELPAGADAELANTLRRCHSTCAG